MNKKLQILDLAFREFLTVTSTIDMHQFYAVLKWKSL
jgi:hypothetical protein